MAVDTCRIRKPKQIRRRRVLDRERATDVACGTPNAWSRVDDGGADDGRVGVRARRRRETTTTNEDDARISEVEHCLRSRDGRDDDDGVRCARASSSCSIARARAHFFREERFFARRKPLGRRATCRRRRADDADATAMTTIPLSLPPSKRTARDHRRRARKSAVRST